MRTCESWAGAVMVREGKDNIKGQAWFGWYTEQLALRIYTGGLQPYTIDVQKKIREPEG
jgi:hypothetical protein